VAESAEAQSQRLIDAALVGIAGLAGLAAIGLAAARQHRALRDGLDPFSRQLGLRRRRPRPDLPEPDGVPVRPDRPLNLSGGAAAALEFDD
jgi:hypothetical protein